MKKTIRITVFFSLILLLLLLVSCQKTEEMPTESTKSEEMPTESAKTEETTVQTEASSCTHDYRFDSFSWSSDGQAEAVYICSKDENHIEKRKAAVEETILREATSSLAGEKRCIASEGGHAEEKTFSYIADTVTLTIYAVNDFHGAVNADYTHAGLAHFATFFKEKGEDGNTLLIDAGDTWQGSIASNYSTGQLLCDIYNYVGFDAKVLGNHEFDWGPEIIARNATFTSYDHTTPFLCANLYDYDFSTKRQGKNQQEELGKKSVVYTLSSGVTVGIIGAIDNSCITSINSLYVQDLCFTDHVKAIKEEATALRRAGCDLVICAFHGDEDAVRGNGLENYVDLMLCAHSHTLESSKEGKLLYAQFKSNGEYFGEITLTYQTKLHLLSTDLANIKASNLTSAVKEVDPGISAIIARYDESFRADAEVVVASKVSGSFGASEELPNLMCRAMYDACIKAGYEIDLAYVNKARATLGSGVWTYEDLYEAFPFDDLVFIAEVSGRELLNEVARYNYIYRSPDFTGSIDPDATYRIACVDYLFFHTNIRRSFDFFPTTAGRFTGVLEDNYRVILRDWLINEGYNEGKTLSSGDYSSSLPTFDRAGLAK